MIKTGRALRSEMIEVMQDASAEEGFQERDGKQETLAIDPSCAVERQSTGGDDAVDVGMKEEFSGPGVQHGRDAELESEVLARQDGESLADGIHEKVEDQAGVLLGQWPQLAGQRENHVVMPRRKHAGFAGLDPAGLLEGLAIGAVSVSAGVVDRQLVAAGVADVQVPAEGRRPADHHIAQKARLLGREPRVLCLKLLGMSPEDIDDRGPALSRRLHPRARRSGAGSHYDL